MQCLQCLELYGPFMFDARVLQLTALCSLTEAGLCSDCLFDGSSHLVRFAFDLATGPPHVLSKMDGINW